MSLRDQILAANDTQLEKVEVPEWGTTVYVRNMSGLERDKWELEAFKDGKVLPECFRAKLLVRTLSDEQGNPVFDLADVVRLSGKSAPVLSRLYDIAAKANGLTKDEVEDLTGES